MLNVKKVLNVRAQQAKMLSKSTPAFVKTATKNEQAAMDYFQRVSCAQKPYADFQVYGKKQMPNNLNREFRRLYAKLSK